MLPHHQMNAHQMKPRIIATAGAPGGVKPNLFQSIGLGGAACVFTVNFTHPIELVKTRMQITGNGLMPTISNLLKTEGVTSLWKGIPAAWGREASYASIKLGGYAPIRDLIGDQTGADMGQFHMKFMAGAITGGIGSFVGNPFDVMKTVMQANEGKAISMPTLAADLYKQQGISAFYRGLETNVMRACVLNASKMATYDSAKTPVAKAYGLKKSHPAVVFTASVIAGFVMTLCVSPFDMIRTKLMSQPADKKIYTGFVDCVTKTVSQEGPMALYRGFIPIWGRFAPSATIQLLTIETLYTATGFSTI
jgi:hypothetical protein